MTRLTGPVETLLWAGCRSIYFKCCGSYQIQYDLAAIFLCRLCFLWAFPFSLKFNLLQLVFSACVATVKLRRVLQHCVVILFCSSGIMDSTLFTYRKYSYAHAIGGDSGVASWITSDEQLQLNLGCYFPMQAMFPVDFPFSHFLNYI